MPAQLEELQGFLAAAFQRQAPVHGDAALLPGCSARVTGNERLTPAEQVDIYRRQFWLRHIDSLREDYPALAALLGEDAFEAFSTAYLTAHPPRTPSLRELGDDIVAFARGYEGFPEELKAAARDLARYENAFIDVFDGPEPPPLDAAKIQGMAPEAWESARVVLHPRTARMRVETPVHLIRAAVKAGEAIARPPEQRPVCLMIYRKNLRIHFEELEPLAFDLLCLLAEGQALVPACDQIAAAAGPLRAADLEAQVGGWFQEWTARGWIIDIAL